MNTFQQISRELVVEDLQRKRILDSAIESDPVTRQFMWRRLRKEQARVFGRSHLAGTDEAKANRLVSLWKRLFR